MFAFFNRSSATKRSLSLASGSSRMLRSWRRWPGRNRCAMSRIASRVSAVSASGSTRTNVPAGVSNVETPSVVTSRYGVVSWPRGSSSVKSNSGMDRRLWRRREAQRLPHACELGVVRRRSRDHGSLADEPGQPVHRHVRVELGRIDGLVRSVGESGAGDELVDVPCLLRSVRPLGGESVEQAERSAPRTRRGGRGRSRARSPTIGRRRRRRRRAPARAASLPCSGTATPRRCRGRTRSGTARHRGTSTRR